METQGLSQTAHLVRRNGVYHYRRRVPDALVEAFGRKEVHRSLCTTSLAEAKKRRAVEDLKWETRFEAAAKEPDNGAVAQGSGPATVMPSEQEIVRLVQNYVARADERAQARFENDPPQSAEEQMDICVDAEIGLGILQNVAIPAPPK